MILEYYLIYKKRFLGEIKQITISDSYEELCNKFLLLKGDENISKKNNLRVISKTENGFTISSFKRLNFKSFSPPLAFVSLELFPNKNNETLIKYNFRPSYYFGLLLISIFVFILINLFQLIYLKDYKPILIIALGLIMISAINGLAEYAKSKIEEDLISYIDKNGIYLNKLY